MKCSGGKLAKMHQKLFNALSVKRKDQTSNYKDICTPNVTPAGRRKDRGCNFSVMMSGSPLPSPLSRDDISVATARTIREKRPPKMFHAYKVRLHKECSNAGLWGSISALVQ